MHLEIIAPDKNIYSGEVDYVQLPGVDGLFGVLKDHAPLISALGKGKVLVQDHTSKEIEFSINGGVVEVNKNNIMVLAE